MSSSVPRSSRTLSEHDSRALLAGHGIPVAADRLADSPDDAVAAAGSLGFPVVVKLCGDAIAHKSERGLVRLNLAGADAVRHAGAELLALARPDDGPVSLLVSRMVHGHRELIAGLVRDPVFGPCVMLGIGGILAEAIADVVFRLVPLDRVDAAEMIDDLATRQLLGAFRGEPAVDREKTIDVLVGLGEIARRRPDVRSIDVNPLIVCDGIPVAVDALVEVGG